MDVIVAFKHGSSDTKAYVVLTIIVSPPRPADKTAAATSVVVILIIRDTYIHLKYTTPRETF